MDADKEVTKVDGPRRTGKPAEDLSLDTLTGKLFPWDASIKQPVLLRMPGSPYHYIALFSSKRKLEDLMREAEIEFDIIKQVVDGREFMAGLAESAPEIVSATKVILDPHFTNEGRVRFTELMLNVS